MTPVNAPDEKNVPKKRGRGRPAIGRGIRINVVLRPKDVEALDAWIAVEQDAPSRSEAVRRLLDKALGA